MRNRGVIVWLLGWIAAAAVLFLWPARPVRQAERAGVRDPDDILALSVTRGDTVMSLVRTGGTWRIAAPVAGETDPAAVERLLDVLAFKEPGDAVSLADIRRQRRTLAGFGLDPADITIRYRTLLDEETLFLGRYTADGGEVYARRADGSAVFTLPADVRRAADREADAFRSRRVLDLTGILPTVVSLRMPGTPLVKLSRTAPGAWRVTLPADAPADPRAVQTLAEAFAKARIVSYAARETGVADIRDYDNRVAVRFADVSGKGDTVVFGRDVPGTNLVYALVRQGTTVVKLPTALRDLCRETAATLRDMRLFPIEPAAVRQVALTVDDALWTLARADAQADWRLTSPVAAGADEAMATGLVARVLALRQDDAAVSNATASVTLAVSGEAIPEITRRVSREILADLGNPANLRSREVISFARADVRAVTVSTASGHTFGADYDTRRGGWNGRGVRVREEAVGKMLEVFSRVTAESVENIEPTPQELERCGLSRPAFTLTVDFAVQSVRRNLLLGNAAPGGGRYAATGVKDVVFIVSAETVAALTQPLAE